MHDLEILSVKVLDSMNLHMCDDMATLCHKVMHM